MDEKKLVIDIFRTKTADDFTKAIADPDGKLETGSAAADAAAIAAALVCRAAKLTAKTLENNDRVDYIARNSDIIRSYMVHLIDEDVKCRGPLRMAKKEGDARKIEACRQTSLSICTEIINMMSQLIDMANELSAACPADALYYAAEGTELALTAVKITRLYIVSVASQSPDETYRYVTRRENELTLEACSAAAAEVTTKAEESLQTVHD